MQEIAVTSPPAPWQPKDAVGRYTLFAPLARGGMAEIWLAHQAGPQGFEKVVVIKRMTGALEDHPEFVSMFLDEARVAAQLQHPHIVQIYDLGEHQGSYYIAMEYLAGETLQETIRAGIKAGAPLPINYAVRIIADVADALAHAHAKTDLDGKPFELVHCDISPQNVIITYDGYAKVVDFGIANIRSDAASTQLKGKVAYVAPEQVQGEPLDARTDIFSLGVVLYEAITRTRLFLRDTPEASLEAVISDEPIPAASSRNPEVPASLEAILSLALARNRADRYETAGAFHAALEEWLASETRAPRHVDIARFMEARFEERIRQRAQLIGGARSEATPRFGSVVPAPSPPPFRMGGGVPEIAPASAPKRRRLTWLGAGAAVLAVAGWLGARQLADGSTTVSVANPEPTRAVVPASVLQHSGSTPQPVPGPPARRPSKPSPGVAKVAKAGSLSLDTDPWTEVYFGNKKLGETPLIDVPLPAGQHRLKLVNTDANITREVEIEVEAGKTTAKQLRF